MTEVGIRLVLFSGKSVPCDASLTPAGPLHSQVSGGLSISFYTTPFSWLGVHIGRLKHVFWTMGLRESAKGGRWNSAQRVKFLGNSRQFLTAIQLVE